MGLKTVGTAAPGPARGRGAVGNPHGRFDPERREVQWDDQDPEADLPGRAPTVVTAERARSIVSRNDSPDIPFVYSINPYRGCEHGCIYCYARPSHAYLGLSPGLDFETRLFAKVNAPELLREFLARPGYACEPIALGANTDPYQPVERQWKITRALVEEFARCEHPFTIVTKNALVERDLDLLAPLGAKRLLKVFVSITTLDNNLARHMEPRASSPQRRLQAITRLREAGIPVGVLVAPVIPFLTDAELESILEAAAAAGAGTAGYVLLRLPHELKDLFKDWLAAYFPLKAAHVMSRIRDMRDGQENDARFGSRQSGTGVLAQLLAKRFAVARERYGLATRSSDLDCSLFRRPDDERQGRLF